jgi:hypothetical protein
MYARSKFRIYQTKILVLDEQKRFEKLVHRGQSQANKVDLVHVKKNSKKLYEKKTRACDCKYDRRYNESENKPKGAELMHANK